MFLNMMLRAVMLLTGLLFLHAEATSQTVTIDYHVQRYLGDVSELDRSKYFNVHDNSSNDPDFDAFHQDYRVGRGRGFWGPYSYAKGKQGSVGSYPTARGGSSQVKQVSRFISTEHPANVVRWSIDIQTAADWAVEYWKNFVNDAGRPEFFEPMNEPFVHAGDAVFKAEQPDADSMRRRMAEWFGAIGKSIHEAPELANMKVIGYSSAWPSVELWDFGHWDSRMKMFMDVAGVHMDAFATHLYDGINVTGQPTLRSGSNSEAILDLIEAYSYIKWGFVKDHAISEYGGIEKGYGPDYSHIGSSQTMRSLNHLIFNLLEREDKMAISIPFITGKATWHINAANHYQPYGATLFIPTNIGQPTPAGWQYSPRILFYELWKDVEGKRVDVQSDDFDVQVQAFVDSQILYVVLNNLDENSKTVNLDFPAGVAGLEDVHLKSLHIFTNALPAFKDTLLASAPQTLNLRAGETSVLAYRFQDAMGFDNAIRRTKYYPAAYLQPIQAQTEMNFSFNGVDHGSGRATLRMSIGRKHNMSKQPIVKVNGTTVNVPTNWKGYDQANRDDFYGTIEIPVPANLLQAQNLVTLTFPDDGGRVAALVLSVEKYDQAVSRDMNQPVSLDHFLNMYPNPVSAQTGVSIELPSDVQGRVMLSLIDKQGRRVLKMKMSSQKGPQKLGLEGVRPGVYVVIAKGKDWQVEKKLVVVE